LEALAVVDSVYDPRLWATHGVQVTHDGKWLWTANQQSDNIAVIDTDNDSLVAIIKIDPAVPDGPPTGVPQFGPYQLVFTADDDFAYVTCRFSNEVRVFDTQTRQLVTVIPVGVNPLILDISPDDEFVYVANRGTGASPSKTVSVIRTSDNTELLKIQDVGVEPHGVAVTADGALVYVACENTNNPDTPHHPVTGLKTPGYVVVIDVATNQVVKRIEVGAFGAGIAVLP
jgi:YVTN family beta-propeller protein